MDPVEVRVLRRILPTEDEERRLRAVVRDLTDRLDERITARGLDAKPILVGSVAKGVHLHEPEVDMFVAFSPDLPRQSLEQEGLAFGDILERPVRMYAEHPYTRGWYKGFEVEIVPCYRITDAAQRLSPVDGNRNVASAVSAEQLATFVHAAREYLAKPSERFFFPRPMKPWPTPRLKAALRKRETHVVAVSMPAPMVTEDVSYPQVRKAH